MLKWLEIIVRTIVSKLCTQRSLAIENLVLRKQLAVSKHRHPRLRLTDTDRFFWVVLSRIWWIGESPFISLSLKPLFAGTGKASDTTGAGRAVAVGDQGLILRFDS